MRLHIFKNKKLLLITGSALIVFIIALVIILFQMNKETEVSILGEAEAVATTRVNVYDGLWDEKRYSDEFFWPIGIALKGENLIVADNMCDRIQILDGGQNLRIGKPGQYGLSFRDSGALVDGYREDALFAKPSGIALDNNGDIIVCDTENHAIRRIDDEVVLTIAGNGEVGYREGKETEAQFNSPRGIAIDNDGNIYIADTMNHCIRRIDNDGNVTLYAGAPGQNGYQDGALSEAKFYEPCGLYLSKEGDLFIADSANQCIRKISGGMVTTVAGKPGEIDNLTGYPKSGYIDGDNKTALFNFPKGLTMLDDGTLIVADTLNHVIRAVTNSNTRTIAGNGMAEQFYKSAENIKLTRPEGVYADGDTLYISDTGNNRVIEMPLVENILKGRPNRDVMLRETGITTDSKYPYKGDIRVYIDSEKVDMGRVVPWNTAENIYVPIRPLFEALGGVVTVDEKTDTITIETNGLLTVLALEKDYFIMKGVAVTTADEISRLFPYTFEWYPEFSLIALHNQSDLW